MAVSENAGTDAVTPEVSRVNAGLPRRHCSASVLLLDPQNRVLIVKPAYREGWLMPGGIVEAGETPAKAALRELYEETGIQARLSRLVCVDSVPARGGFNESIHYLFGAHAEPSSIASAVADGIETIDLKFLDPGQAADLLPLHIGCRLRSALAGYTGYFEDGHLVLPFTMPLEISPSGAIHSKGNGP